MNLLTSSGPRVVTTAGEAIIKLKGFAGVVIEGKFDGVGEIRGSNIGEVAFLDGVGELEGGGELGSELVVIFLANGGGEELDGGVEVTGVTESSEELFVVLVGQMLDLITNKRLFVVKATIFCELLGEGIGNDILEFSGEMAFLDDDFG